MSSLSASAEAFEMPREHQTSANPIHAGVFDNQTAYHDSSYYAGGYIQQQTPGYENSCQYNYADQWQAPGYSHGWHQAAQWQAPQFSRDCQQLQTAYYTEYPQTSGYTHSTISQYVRKEKRQSTNVINLDDFSDVSDSDDEQPTGKKSAEAARTNTLSQNLKMATEEKVNPPEPTTLPASAYDGNESEPFAEPSPCALGADVVCFPDSGLSRKNEDDQERVEEQEDDEGVGSTLSEPESEAEESRGSVEMKLHELLRWQSACDENVEPALYIVEEKSSNAWQSKNEQEVAAHRQEAVATPKKSDEDTSCRSSKTVETPTKPDEAVSWRSSQPARTAKLDVSDSSWLAEQQRRRRSAASEDERVARSVKSILNKLTLEKFQSLVHQLLNCGISNASHVELLIQELFEKATLQHNFIEMYADLCVLLHEHFLAKPYASPHADRTSRKSSFKKLLLDECQASFERTLAPPAPVGKPGSEEQNLADVNYKAQLLGNIKLVGALLSRGMLAGKVGIAIMEELLSTPTPEALESLAALLTVIGLAFDRPDWQHRAMLSGVFQRVQAIVEGNSCPGRQRCLLKDVLDLRSRGWKEIRPMRVERPMTLSEVAQQQAATTRAATTVAKSNLLSLLGSKPVLSDMTLSEVTQQQAATTVAATTVAKRNLLSLLGSQPVLSDKPAERHCQAFRQDVFRSEVRKAVRELRASGQPAEALTRLTAFEAPSPGVQAGELCELLVEVVQEGSQEVRRQGFEVIIKLAKSSDWSVQALSRGLGLFLSEQAPDLVYDVPDLPQILGDLHSQLCVVRGISSKELDAVKLFSSGLMARAVLLQCLVGLLP